MISRNLFPNAPNECGEQQKEESIIILNFCMFEPKKYLFLLIDRPNPKKIGFFFFINITFNFFPFPQFPQWQMKENDRKYEP